MTTTTFKTTGMHCPSCSMLVEMAVEDLDGVEKVKVDLASESTTVTYDPATVTSNAVIDAIAQAGYSAELA